MAVSYENTIIGKVISTGAPQDLLLPFIPDEFETWNQTNQGSTATPGVVKKSTWFNGMAADSAFVVQNTAGAATDTSSVITSGGFTAIDGGALELGPSILITSITQANPAVVTTGTPHGLTTGDIVGFYNVTGMQQISTLFVVVTVTGASTFTIQLNTTGFAAPATAGFIRKVNKYSNWVPPAIVITNITQANPGVVTTSVPNGYATNDIYRLILPQIAGLATAAWGMSQLNEVQVTITVLTPTTFSVGIDTTAFTAFNFPPSGNVPFSFPEVIPVGEFGVALTDSVDNTASFGVHFGSAVAGATNDVIWYRAMKGV